MININNRAPVAGAVLMLGIISGNAYASGFAIIEHSASGMGNAFAGGSAIAEDASTVYFNPAGMMNIKGSQIVGAGHLILLKADFDNQGSTTSTLTGSQPLTGPEDDGGTDALVPNFYYLSDLSSSWKFGFGVNSPFGLKVEYDDDWVGRYHAVTSDLITVNLNPSLAYRVNSQFSIGFGISAQYADVTLSSAIDMGSICVALLPVATCAAMNNSLPQQKDGFLELTGDGWGFGYNFGFLFEIDPQSRLGLHYRSNVSHELEGDADVKVPFEMAFLQSSNIFVDTGIQADVTFPATLSVSYFNQLNNTFAVMVDWTHTWWSKFQELRVEYDSAQPDSVTTEEWIDTNRVAVGLNYQAAKQWLIRFGAAWDKTPVPSKERRTARLPGSTRTWITAGFNFKQSEKFSFDFGYAHLFIEEAPIDNEFESSVPTLSHNLKGEYNGSVDIFSAQANWNF